MTYLLKCFVCIGLLFSAFLVQAGSVDRVKKNAEAMFDELHKEIKGRKNRELHNQLLKQPCTVVSTPQGAEVTTCKETLPDGRVETCVTTVWPPHDNKPSETECNVPVKIYESNNDENSTSPSSPCKIVQIAHTPEGAELTTCKRKLQDGRVETCVTTVWLPQGKKDQGKLEKTRCIISSNKLVDFEQLLADLRSSNDKENLQAVFRLALIDNWEEYEKNIIEELTHLAEKSSSRGVVKQAIRTLAKHFIQADANPQYYKDTAVSRRISYVYWCTNKIGGRNRPFVFQDIQTFGLTQVRCE